MATAQAGEVLNTDPEGDGGYKSRYDQRRLTKALISDLKLMFVGALRVLRYTWGVGRLSEPRRKLNSTHGRERRLRKVLIIHASLFLLNA